MKERIKHISHQGGEPTESQRKSGGRRTFKEGNYRTKKERKSYIDKRAGSRVAKLLKKPGPRGGLCKKAIKKKLNKITLQRKEKVGGKTLPEKKKRRCL